MGEAKRRRAYMEKMFGPVIVEEVIMTYDHWKATEPDDAYLSCEVCGSRLRKDMRTGRFYCEECYPEDETDDEIAEAAKANYSE